MHANHIYLPDPIIRDRNTSTLLGGGTTGEGGIIFLKKNQQYYKIILHLEFRLPILNIQ